MAINYQFFYTMKRTKNVLFLLLATIAMALSLSSCSTMGGFRNSKNPMRFEALCLTPIHDDSLNAQTGSEAVFESTNGYEAAFSASVSKQEAEYLSVYISE